MIRKIIIRQFGKFINKFPVLIAQRGGFMHARGKITVKFWCETSLLSRFHRVGRRFRRVGQGFRPHRVGFRPHGMGFRPHGMGFRPYGVAVRVVGAAVRVAGVGKSGGFWRRCGRQLGGVGDLAILMRRQLGELAKRRSSPQTIPAKAGISQCRACNNRQESAIPPKLTPPLAANGYEIPAFAGMVCGLNAKLSANPPIVHEGIAKSVNCPPPPNTKIRPHTSVPPQDHSCEGRNLTVLCLQQSARIRHFAKIDAAVGGTRL